MYKQILLAVDLEDETSWQRAAPAAIELARSSGATLHVMTVAPNFGYGVVGGFFPKGYESEIEGKMLAALHAFTAEHVPSDLRLQHIVSQGTIYKEILDAAKKLGVDLIVIASNRDELADYLLGPNAARVVRHARCSVLVVRE